LNAKDESPKKPKSKLDDQVALPLGFNMPNAIPSVADHTSSTAPIPKSDGTVGKEDEIEGFFEPNGEISDIYVQGSK
jgi:hypothetical protein